MATARIGKNLALLHRFLNLAALEPVLTGSLLLALTKGSPRLREYLLRPFARTSFTTDKLVQTLKLLFALGVARRANRLLSDIALNHWCLRRQGVPWDFSSRKEVCIVTGGCSGFGYLISKGLAPKTKLVVIDIQDPPPDLRELGVRFYKCDITSAPAVSECAIRIRQEVGVPSILINNAGIATAHTILQTEEEWLEKIFRVNLLSHFTLIKEFLPGMLEMKKGHIVALASMASYFSGAGLADYCCTKAGVLALHEGLNAELKTRYPNGLCIQTSIVHPLWAQTPLIKDWESTLAAGKEPLLPPSAVADPVIRQVLSGKSGQIFVPEGAKRYSGIRGWPIWLQEYARAFVGRATKPVG